MTKALVVLVVVLLLAAGLTAGDVSGEWALALDPDFGGLPDQTEYCTFRQAEGQLTGNCSGTPISGEVNDRDIMFRFKTGRNDEITATLTGTLDDRAITIKGTWHLDGGDLRDSKFYGTKR